MVFLFGVMKVKKLVSILILTVYFLCMLCSCAFRPEQYSGSFIDTFDTVITLYGFAKDATQFNSFAALCHEEFLYYHKLFDIYNEYEGINNLKTVNDNAGESPVKVEKALLDLIIYAKDLYSQTGGMVNIAMGSVLSLWHNYRNEGLLYPTQAGLPSENELKTAARLMDMDKVIINEDQSTLFLSQKGMSLDVGALAKGYACEKVADNLKNKGFENFVISAGGNVYACGSPQDDIGKKWSIGIKNPDLGDTAALTDTVYVENMAVVTAGSYERYYTVNGQTYSHIISPKTLMPGNDYLSVTVIAPSSALADYMATELFLTDIQGGKALCEKMDIEALWILENGELVCSEGYRQYSNKISK